MLFIFFLAAGFQLLCWGLVLRAGYQQGREADVADPGLGSPPVSVIVCFRNERETLEACVKGILAQHYPGDFELLLVDDNSTDDSAAIARPYVSRHAHVRLLDPGPTRAGKKDALAFGIAAAMHDFLILTDADCVPASKQWLRRMAGPLQNGAELVLGVSPYVTSEEAPLLTAWQRFEAAYVSLKYLGFARVGLPYMGVGRNLAYRRSFYARAGGFAAHADLPGGDDDLLVSATARAEATARVVHPAAWTYSAPRLSWRSYFRQRARHQSVGIRYPAGAKWLLAGLALSHGLFYLLGFFLLFTDAWMIAAGVYLLRFFLLIDGYSGADVVTEPAERAGAKKGWMSSVFSVGKLAFFDAWVGPMYLFLAVAGLRPARGW